MSFYNLTAKKQKNRPERVFLGRFLLTIYQKAFIIVSNLPMNRIAVHPVTMVELLMIRGRVEFQAGRVACLDGGLSAGGRLSYKDVPRQFRDRDAGVCFETTVRHRKFQKKPAAGIPGRCGVK